MEILVTDKNSKVMSQKKQLWILFKEIEARFCAQFFFFPVYFYGILCICTSAAPQRPAHGTVSSQVATHLRTDRVCRVLGRSWIRTQDYWFAVRCATIEPPLLEPLSHLSSKATSPQIFTLRTEANVFRKRWSNRNSTVLKYSKK